MSTWLVTGGAGYIGAHVVNSLINKDFKVIVVDDLSTGLERKIPQSAIFEKLDIANTKELTAVLTKHNVDGVIHYGVCNMPAQTPRTSTIALAAQTLPYITQLADMGPAKAIHTSSEVKAALTCFNGMITNKPTAEALGRPVGSFA